MKSFFLFLQLATFISYSTAQNVGIGIANPLRAKFEVFGAVDATTAIFGTDGTGISLQRNFPGIGFNDYFNNGHRNLANGFAALQVYDPNNGSMYFDMGKNGTAGNLVVGSLRTMVISPDGRVGIGSGDAPNASLTVVRGTAIDGTAVFKGTTHWSHFNYGTPEHTYIRAGKNNGNVYINDIPGGKVAIGGGSTFVGINTSDPSYTLELLQANNKGISLVNSNFDSWEIFNGLPLFFKFNSTVKAFIDAGDGHYAQISDARLKTNIAPLSGVLGNVMKLQPVSYNMIKQPAGRRSIGFIAQELQQLFPELVTIADDSATGYTGIHDLHMVDYSGFGVLAIKAIQEQQAEIEALKIQNARLADSQAKIESQNQKQEAAIEALRAELKELHRNLSSKPAQR